MTEESTSSPVRYTIMPDYGHTYGWESAEDTTGLLGINCGSSAGWSATHPISEALQQAFAAWQAEFDRAEIHHHPYAAALDWKDFHRRGLELTRQLKAEIGDAAQVFYEKPCEDPNEVIAQRREILGDGILVEVPHHDQNARQRFDWLPTQVISGGQTGVDRAALDWATGQRIAHGGWCPKGRLAADGVIPIYFQLRETPSAGDRQRTRLNVQDSDATLIFNLGEVDGGTLQTVRFAQTMNKPLRVFQLDQSSPKEVAQRVVDWLSQGRFASLNVAGPREEKRPGIYALVMDVLDQCLVVSEPAGKS